MSIERPELPEGFDQSRARTRREDPAGWRFTDEHRAGLWRAITERRDIRRFRPDPLPEALLERLLNAAHAAPSVGLMQPWRFIVVRDPGTLAAMQGIAQHERLAQAPALDERARQYLDLKLEGIREAPLSICICCDRRPGEEILGRHTIPDTDLYSTCLAIENLWLAARAEGVGIGWVSFYSEDDVRALLGIPAHVVPVAWLCVGYPDERPVRPGLEAAGWGRRSPLSDHVFTERWGGGGPVGPAPAQEPGRAAVARTAAPDWWRELAAGVLPGEHQHAVAVRDRLDELAKPIGSLGVLEGTLERWAAATGRPLTEQPSAGILVLAADHGVAAHDVSLYPARVGSQVAAAAARGETAIGVLARALDAELIVADLGLTGPAPRGPRPLRIADGSADITTGPAMAPEQFFLAVSRGHELGAELAERHGVLIVGEIGIANTTVAAALTAGLLGLDPAVVCGRGTGLDAQGLERKRTAVTAALTANAGSLGDPIETLRCLGGLELAGLAGAMLAAAARRVPVLLDGYAVGAAALAATRAVPALRDYLIAGHRSAEPAHQLILTELGLEPLLDDRLRLGEASGAALALPLLGLAARIHAEMASFDDAGVERA